jgi:environmental stress-induced protein Ves
MTWQLIRLADAVPSPWRNGGGVTRELAAWPTGGNWTWRISVAEVGASGPFSRFEGVQRWFAVLGGNGVSLKVADAEHRLTRASAPFEFGGELAVDCQLQGGPTQDLNLMVQRDRASASMKRLEGAQQHAARAGMILAIYACDAPACVRDDQGLLVVAARSLAWRRVPADTQVEVTAARALWMEIEPCR